MTEKYKTHLSPITWIMWDEFDQQDKGLLSQNKSGNKSCVRNAKNRVKSCLQKVLALLIVKVNLSWLSSVFAFNLFWWKFRIKHFQSFNGFGRFREKKIFWWRGGKFKFVKIKHFQIKPKIFSTEYGVWCAGQYIFPRCTQQCTVQNYKINLTL